MAVMPSDQLLADSPAIMKSPLVQKDPLTNNSEEACSDMLAATSRSPQVPPAEHGTIVYVGNLSFRTRKEGLASHFEGVGTVLHSKIVTFRHGYRRLSCGYGFIKFATTEEVQKAIKELNKKELDGRKILVQVARSQKGAKSVIESPKNGVVGEPETTAPQKMPNEMEVQDKDTNDTADRTELDDTTTEQSIATRTRRRRLRRPKKTLNNSTELEDAPVATEESIPTHTRQRRHRQKPNTSSSQTTLFVTKLPRSSTDDTLKDIFKDFEIKSAKVIRTTNGRSRGYGFVEMVSQEECSRALESVKNVELEGHLIIIDAGRSHTRPQASNSKEIHPSPTPGSPENTANKKILSSHD